MVSKLLMCTLKKSVSVTVKVVIAAVIMAIVFFAKDAVLQFVVPHLIDIFAKAWTVVGGIFWNGISVANAILLMIPWWVWLIGAVAMMIVLYSFVWCVRQVVTEKAMDDSRITDAMITTYLAGASIGCLIGTPLLTAHLKISSLPLQGIIFIVPWGVAFVLIVLDFSKSYPVAFRPLFAYYYMKKDERANKNKSGG